MGKLQYTYMEPKKLSEEKKSQIRVVMEQRLKSMEDEIEQDECLHEFVEGLIDLMEQGIIEVPPDGGTVSFAPMEDMADRLDMSVKELREELTNA